MKIFKRVLLVTLILGALLIGTGIVMGASFEDLINVVISDDKYIKQDDIMISDNIENVSISMSSRPLVIFESEDKNYIQYYLYEEKETINFSEENQTLTFSLKEKPLKFPWISVGIASSYVSTVYLYLNSSTLKSLDINISSGSVRIDYSKHIDSVNINLSSGSLNVEEIKTKKLTYNSSSGSFNAKNIESDETTIDISSGSVKIDSITGEKLIIEISSGSIKVLDSIVTNTKIKGSSSSVTIYDKRSKDLIGFSAKTSSGSIKIFDNSYKEKSDDKNKYDIYYDISISSGSIKIYN